MTIVGFGLLCLLKVDSGAGIWAGLYASFPSSPLSPTERPA